MQLSDKGAAFVRAVEGFVDHWYADPTGTGTIGIGFTWGSAGFREWWDRNRPGKVWGRGATMTKAEADSALTFVIAADLGKAVNGFFGRDVAPNVFDATCSVAYNCGAGALSDHWAQLLKAGDIAGAAASLKTDRVTSKGRRFAGLVNRRRDEAELIQFSDYTIGLYQPDALADGLLERGERGPAVIELQTQLARIKVYAGKIDGIFGYGTEAAVLAFQRGHALTADGWAGPKTLAALKAFAGA